MTVLQIPSENPFDARADTIQEWLDEHARIPE